MNPTGFGFETAPQPPDPPAERRNDRDAPVPAHAAPADPEDADQRGENPAEEPGYGHGV